MSSLLMRVQIERLYPSAPRRLIPLEGGDDVIMAAA